MFFVRMIQPMYNYPAGTICFVTPTKLSMRTDIYNLYTLQGDQLRVYMSMSMDDLDWNKLERINVSSQMEAMMRLVYE